MADVFYKLVLYNDIILVLQQSLSWTQVWFTQGYKNPISGMFKNVLKSSDSDFLEFLSKVFVLVHQHAMNIYFLIDITITNVTFI